MNPNYNSSDPYEVLGILRTSTTAQIKKAYHKLSLKNHPDKTGNDPIKNVYFQKINDAFSELSGKDNDLPQRRTSPPPTPPQRPPTGNASPLRFSNTPRYSKKQEWTPSVDKVRSQRTRSPVPQVNRNKFSPPPPAPKEEPRSRHQYVRPKGFVGTDEDVSQYYKDKKLKELEEQRQRQASLLPKKESPPPKKASPPIQTLGPKPTRRKKSTPFYENTHSWTVPGVPYNEPSPPVYQGIPISKINPKLPLYQAFKNLNPSAAEYTPKTRNNAGRKLRRRHTRKNKKSNK